MAVLSDAERVEAFAGLNRQSDLAIQGLLKAELRAAVDAADNWIEANSASFNTAIPQPARGALNPRQKAALLMYVVQRRFGVL